jgi:MFS family permease
MRRLVACVYALFFVDELLLLGIVPLAPTFADEFSLSETETGLLLASASIATVFVAVPAGLLADRLGARRLTIGAGVVLAVGALGQGLADSFWLLLLGRVVFGAGSAVIWTAGTAWLSDSIPASRRSSALGAVMMVAGVGSAVGPALAGALAEHASLGSPFLLGSGAAAVVTVALLLASRGRSAEHGHLPVLATLKAVRAERLVLAGLAVTLLAGLSDGVVGLLAPLQLDDNGVSASSIGFAFSVAAATFLVLSTVIVRFGDRAAGIGVGAAGAALLAASLAPFLASTSTGAVVTGVVVRATCVALLYTISFPLAARGAIRAGMGRGAAIGLLNLGWGAATLVGPLVAGALAQTVGMRAAYAGLTALAAATTVWLVLARAREADRAPLEATESARGA